MAAPAIRGRLVAYTNISDTIFQFPSWYNSQYPNGTRKVVFPAFQFPSWYNRVDVLRYDDEVFPAFQFPSWYNFRRRI